MRLATTRIVLTALLVVGVSGAAFARGGGGSSGSGLSPYAALSGNDRSAGVNNGNYSNPRLDPYIRAYPPRTYPGYYAPVRPGYYGYPY